MNTTRPTKKVEKAYYLIPMNGGFQARELIIEDDTVLSDEPLSDPDAWDQTMIVLENELSKKFQ
jgi:hypothetical protein